jgi:hypothetical protein
VEGEPEDGKPDRRTGQELHQDIRAMIAEAKSPMQVILHRVSSRGDPSRRRSVQPPQALEGPELALEASCGATTRRARQSFQTIGAV